MALDKKIVCLITFLIIFTNGITITTANQEQNTSIYSENNECYVIEGVPYISQDETIFCEYAAIEIVLKYYGLNISQIDIFYHIGGGFSMGYKPSFDLTPPIIQPPFKFKFWTDETCGGTYDYKFLANIYGLSFEYIYPDRIINKQKTWDEYWERLKNYIKNDTPVVTGVDAVAWPPFLEIHNITYILPAIFADSHVITVVGFNESNNSVCVNDPGTGCFGYPEKGTYRWVTKDVFKRAVGRMHSELNHYKYTMLIFENKSTAISKDLATNLTLQRNIQRMKGDKDAYDADFVNSNFQKYGINALTELKKDLETKFMIRFPAIRLISKLYPASYPFEDVLRIMKRNAYWESVCKTYISNYLMQNKNLSEHYETTAKLLEIESGYWSNLSIHAAELEEAVKNHSFLKSFILTKQILKKLTDTIDDIIIIEKLIINNSESD